MINENNNIHINELDSVHCNDLYCLLHQILRYLRYITSADAGSIYLHENNHLKFSIFQNDSFEYHKIQELQKPLENLKFPIQENTGTIAIETFLSKKIISIDDIYLNDEYNFKSAKKFDKDFDYSTKSMLTAPLSNYFNGDIIGVVQLINKKDTNNKNIAFSNSDKETISLVSHLIALSISTVEETDKEIQKLNDSIDEKVAIKTQNMKKINEQLKNQAYTDPLTGLYNRRQFDEISEKIMTLNIDRRSQGSLIILDIDNFKNVNDTYGHAVGDKVLINLSDILKKILRNDDVCVRYGGEEFVVVLPFTDKNNAIFLADKIRMTIEEEKVKYDANDSLNYTISLGVTSILPTDKDIDEVLHRADTALYKAKEDGKNKVYFF